MRAGDIISTSIPVVEVGCTARECLDIMVENGLDNIFVVENSIYRGTVTLQQCSENDNKIKVGEFFTQPPAAQAQAHILEAVELFSEQPHSLLAVVDAANNYIGCITSTDIIKAVSTLCNAAHPGAVIEIEMFPEEYSMTEIARLIEDNHCKLITLFSYTNNATGLLHVQIRTTCEDATPILQSFERYGYRVVATYYPQGRIDKRTEQRLRELMYYLEM